MSPWTPRRSGERHRLIRALEVGIKPARDAVDEAGLGDLEVERDLNRVQRLDRNLREVEPGVDAGGDQTIWVDVVHDGLLEVLLRASLNGRGEVNPVEVGVLPKAVLVLLLPMKKRIGKRSYTDRSNIREHLATGLEKPVTSTEIALDHPFVEQKGANGLGHQHVYLPIELGCRDSLHRSADHLYLLRQKRICVREQAHHFGH
mmetsp:Transcript_25974/g.61930  ORF Transcript_25974/g.61930 Transcript_25974/m.61930 type:complete len:203 (-) Transcript_25974:641-1249(-)